jgi:uncharacterized protein (DUF488 family)
MVNMMTLYTIGYEGLSMDSFLGLLHDHRISTLIDVRETPISRKPGFSKTSLASKLEQAGVFYLHLVKLGCPRAIRNQYRADRDWQTYTQAYLQHLQQQREALSSLNELATAGRCVLLCFEADANQCHRKLVAEAVQQKSAIAIEHIRLERTFQTATSQQNLFENDEQAG